MMSFQEVLLLLVHVLVLVEEACDCVIVLFEGFITTSSTKCVYGETNNPNICIVLFR